ncbi:hypothetical protein JZX87_28300 [Agrobacterium sp. Ap1]|jgi:hypothetical protein|nr:hypothetical protein [Agrobacterium sp. Ap1]MBO0145040.1 hypothetical protein [Agrobacterium sp. Ap1]
MALAFERQPELGRVFRKPVISLAQFERWLAHCAITGAFGFVTGLLIFL